MSDVNSKQTEIINGNNKPLDQVSFEVNNASKSIKKDIGNIIENENINSYAKLKLIRKLEHNLIFENIKDIIVNENINWEVRIELISKLEDNLEFENIKDIIVNENIDYSVRSILTEKLEHNLEFKNIKDIIVNEDIHREVRIELINKLEHNLEFENIENIIINENIDSDVRALLSSKLERDLESEDIKNIIINENIYPGIRALLSSKLERDLEFENIKDIIVNENIRRDIRIELINKLESNLNLEDIKDILINENIDSNVKNLLASKLEHNLEFENIKNIIINENIDSNIKSLLASKLEHNLEFKNIKDIITNENIHRQIRIELINKLEHNLEFENIENIIINENIDSDVRALLSSKLEHVLEFKDIKNIIINENIYPGIKLQLINKLKSKIEFEDIKDIIINKNIHSQIKIELIINSNSINFNFFKKFIFTLNSDNRIFLLKKYGENNKKSGKEFYFLSNNLYIENEEKLIDGKYSYGKDKEKILKLNKYRNNVENDLYVDKSIGPYSILDKKISDKVNGKQIRENNIQIGDMSFFDINDKKVTTEEQYIINRIFSPFFPMTRVLKLINGKTKYVSIDVEGNKEGIDLIKFNSNIPEEITHFFRMIYQYLTLDYDRWENHNLTKDNIIFDFDYMFSHPSVDSDNNDPNGFSKYFNDENLYEEMGEIFYILKDYINSEILELKKYYFTEIEKNNKKEVATLLQANIDILDKVLNQEKSLNFTNFIFGYELQGNKKLLNFAHKLDKEKFT